MTKQISSSPSNKRISELYQRIKEETLVPQPEFQRKFVWTSKHKEAFIDTILQGLPFPEIYIAQTGIDMERIVSTEVVVDGQQRLSTIVQYIDEQEDSKEFGKTIKKYKELTREEKSDFLNYNVVIRDLGDVDEDTIKEIFKRINRTKFNLRQVEIHNAVYDGEFITCAQEILDELDSDHLPIFSDSDLTRMADLHFILLCMATIENEGYFSRDKEIENYVVDFNEEYPNYDTVKTKLVQTFKFINDLGLDNDSMWYRKSNFYTLVIELYDKFDLVKDDLKEKLEEMDRKVIENKHLPKEENAYSLYYSYMYTGTNSRQARVIRSELFQENIFDD